MEFIILASFDNLMRQILSFEISGRWKLAAMMLSGFEKFLCNIPMAVSDRNFLLQKFFTLFLIFYNYYLPGGNSFRQPKNGVRNN